jgi:predicted TIM-barrel fold metal-dependent hydrolase
MKIFDFNIHLPYIKNEDVNVVIVQDMSLGADGIQLGFDTHKHILKDCVGANFLLFNTKLFDTEVSAFFQKVNSSLEIKKYTALIDFRRRDINNYIDNLVKCGVNAVMVNSYLQQIEDHDFNIVLKAFKYAESKGLIICIDGSYGTSKMYNYDNMKLACFIADNITQVPIVIVHAGGYRLIEAMALALDKKNVWLDTSFSLPYYENSSIETDFAYVLKKMNSERIVFGTDHPYIEFSEGLQKHINFFNKYQFNESEVEKILYSNGIKLFNE